MNILKKCQYICLLALLKIPCYAQENYKIWYDTPAHYWEEAIPIGVMGVLPPWFLEILS